MPRRDTTTDTQRYKALTRTVTTVGLLRRGQSRGDGSCRAASRTAAATRRPRSSTARTISGPRKVRGKTVTVRLTEQQAERVRHWIENGRQLDRIVVEMETLSLRMTERLLRQTKPE